MAVVQAPSTLDIVTLVVAILAFSVALASLVWQMASWRLSGPRVIVEIGLGFSVSSGTPVLSVAARNTGRADTQITSWAIQVPDERTYVPSLDPGSPRPLPLPISRYLLPPVTP
jgi:hypothetical protein